MLAGSLTITGNLVGPFGGQSGQGLRLYRIRTDLTLSSFPGTWKRLRNLE